MEIYIKMDGVYSIICMKGWNFKETIRKEAVGGTRDQNFLVEKQKNISESSGYIYIHPEKHLLQGMIMRYIIPRLD